MVDYLRRGLKCHLRVKRYVSFLKNGAEVSVQIRVEYYLSIVDISCSFLVIKI